MFYIELIVFVVICLITVGLVFAWYRRHSRTSGSAMSDQAPSNESHATDTKDKDTQLSISISRLPLLNNQQRIIGYHFTDKGQPFNKKTLPKLIHFLGDESYHKPGTLVFVQLDPELLDEENLSLLPQDAVLIFANLHNLADDIVEKLKSLNNAGFRIASSDQVEESLISQIHFFFIDGNRQENEIRQEIASLRGKKLRIIATNVNNQSLYTFLRSVGINLYQGFFFSNPSVFSPSPLNSQTNNILELIRMISARSEPEDIETCFKRDSNLTFRMLKYINSASLNLTNKVTSIKSAIVILGYNKLVRWLSVLLAISDSSPAEASAALFETGSARGRFMEILAEQLNYDKDDQDKAFMVGMFSLMPIILNLPPENVLTDLNLPEDITSAILLNNGPFAALYKLAIACEQADHKTIESQCAVLALSVDDIYINYIEATKWVNNLDL